MKIPITVIKISILLYAVCLLTFLHSCNPTDPDDCKLDEHTGTMSANINGESWSAYTHGLENSIIGIVGSYYNKPSCRLEQIIALILPYQKTGVFPLSDKVDTLTNHAEMLFSFVDADLLLAHYKIPEGTNSGFVEITSYNPDTKRITGNFNCTVYPFRDYGLANPPDSLVITNGQFETYFPE